MSEGQQYTPLYNQVPAQGSYAQATPVPNPYAAQGQAFNQQGYPAQPTSQPYGQTTGVPTAYAQPVAGVMVAGQPGHLPRTGQWSDGFCDCFNHCESLLVAFCVPPARWAQTVSRAKLLGFGQALLAFGIPWILFYIFYSINFNYNSSCETTWNSSTYRYETTCGGFLLWAISVATLCNIITIVLGCMYRGKIRQQYGIQGSACEDCLLHSFCSLCAITQEARHVDRDTGYLRI